jgi:hypothetical protein
VTAELSRVLPVLCLSGGIDGNLSRACLELPAVAKAIVDVWKQQHTAEVEKAEQEIEVLNRAADAVRQSIEGLAKESQRLTDEIRDLPEKKRELEAKLLELAGKIEAAKAEAQTAIETEMKRLAQSPSSMALLGAWIGAAGNKPTDGAQALIKIQRPTLQPTQSADFKTALLSNLKACGLSPITAAEVSAVCRAAIAAGQPIALRSLFADLLAEAVACALGQPEVVWADVSAGLLEPVDWDQLIPGTQAGRPQILQNVNRSDIPLVLGSLRRSVLLQALGIQKPGNVLLMTLEANAAMRVPSDFPLGPLMDERVLLFSHGKTTSGFSAFSDFAKQLPAVATITAEEFQEIGETLVRLPLLARSAHEIVFRRAYSALRATSDKPGDAPRLFFKYWCLPRSTPDDAIPVLDAHKEVWAQDKSLTELREALTSNG